MRRFMRRLRAAVRLAAGALVMPAFLTACYPFDVPGGIPLYTPLSGADPVLYTEGESNDDFASAEPIGLSPDSEATLQASLGGGGDVDVFSLGPATAGDAVTITVRADPGLSLSIGVFDAEGSLVQLFRLPSINTTRTMQTLCRLDTDALYVTVSGLDGAAVAGNYRLAMRRSSAAVPAPSTQVLVLDFDGESSVSIAGGTPVDVPPFDAANIDARFAGQTEAIRRMILENVRASFAGLGVIVLDSEDPAADTAERSTLYFGTLNPQLLGLADNVDSFNADKTQSAIIFTDTFALFSVLQPSARQIARALANTTSHEAGHLLGLWHVHNASDLMDITATARQMLLPQSFQTSPLHATVLPLGWQNAANLLEWAVGGVFKPDLKSARAMADEPLPDGPDFPVDRRLLSTCVGCRHD